MLGHVALIEQRELQRAALQQPLDRRRTQRRDPIETGRLDVLGDARLGDHAAVADQHHVIEMEALLELVDLCRQRHRIGGIPSNTSMATGQPSGAQSRP